MSSVIIPLNELRKKIVRDLASNGVSNSQSIADRIRKLQPSVYRALCDMEERELVHIERARKVPHIGGQKYESRVWLTPTGMGEALGMGVNPQIVMATLRAAWRTGWTRDEGSELMTELAIAAGEDWTLAHMRGAIADSILSGTWDLELPTNPLEFIRMMYIIKSHKQIARDIGMECTHAAGRYSNLAQVFLDDNWNALHYSILELARQGKGIPPADYLLEFLNAPQNRERGLKKGQALKFLHAVPGLPKELTERSLNLLTAKGWVSEAEDGSIRLTPLGQREAGAVHPEFLSKSLKRREQSITGGARS